MKAELGWIDFSDEHRKSVLKIIDSMGETGTLDQLGVGVVRDAIANWLFPGISTIQTRAKYFILVPQMFQKYLKQNFKKSKPESLREFCKKEEKLIINALAKNTANSNKIGSGIIGITTAGKTKELKTNPSSIYWTGLRTHQIIKTHLSINDYLTSNNLEKGLLNEYSGEVQSDDFNPSDQISYVHLNGLTVYDLETVNMKLSKEEGIFLKEKMIANPLFHGDLMKEEGNLLSLILNSKELQSILYHENTKSFDVFALMALETDLLPEDTREVLHFARNFDFLLHGAHIIYNIKVHELHGNKGNPKFLGDLEDRWKSWKTQIQDNLEVFHNMDIESKLNLYASNTKASNRFFIKEWKRLATTDINNQDAMEDLVRKQEVQYKSNPKQVKSHKGEYDKWIGIESMEFRFKQVKDIIKDILDATR